MEFGFWETFFGITNLLLEFVRKLYRNGQWFYFENCPKYLKKPTLGKQLVSIWMRKKCVNCNYEPGGSPFISCFILYTFTH